MNAAPIQPEPKSNRHVIVWLQRFITTKRPAWLRWSVALGLFLLAFITRYQLASSLPAGFPYLTFFPAVILATFVCGLWPGIINAIAGGLASWYFFIAPAESFELNAGATLALLFYVFIVSVDIFIIHSINVTAIHLQSERRMLETLTQSLQTANDELERNRGDQIILSQELAHRMKNQLAMVQAIASQTMRSSSDLITARSILADRLSALSTAHNLLLSGTSTQTTVGEIISATLSLHDDRINSRFDVAGASITMASRPALSLALILHELSTNAAKYGALSNDTGRVSISWQTEHEGDQSRFMLVWQESGGPPVAPPARIGSGTRLIRAGLSGTLASSVQVDYRPQGLRCEIASELISFQTES